ncbi:MAG: DUF2510 domain-containing protein, partial [Actinomycetota bacterium]
AIAAAFSLLTSRGADDPQCDQALSVLGAVACVGVPLAILLPKNGVSVFDIDDGLVKFGFVIWAVLAPGLALMTALTRRRSGLAFAFGVGVAQLGLTAALLQDMTTSGGSVTGGLSPNNTAIYHWGALASVVLTAAAMAKVVRSTATVNFSVGANVGGYTAQQYPPQQYSPQPGYPANYQQPSPPVAQPVVQPVAQPVAQPAGQWSPDPYGRHQYRLWDGQRWTANVADNGVVSNDPV